ncbi:MAG: amino acid permease [Acidobacteria bacterium]|nr:amino acid permease [Acidobacteriota bacterium]
MEKREIEMIGRATGKQAGFVRELGLLDSTMIVAGSMIGSGIFIVSADIARQVGSPGWLLVVWIVTGLLTLVAAVSYGELAAMMPRAGGQYVYLREAFSPLWGFLYGWTLFLVIQTGTIAAVAIGFAKYLGELWPWVSEQNYVMAPVRITSGYAVSLSTAQLVAVLAIALLTWLNTRGLRLGKVIQNTFTIAKTGALLLLIGLGVAVARNPAALSANFTDLWTARGALQDVGGGLTAATLFGLFVAVCVAQTNSLFSADAWNNITFTAGEVKNPRRNIPLSLALGTFLVIGLYLLANVAYLLALPLSGDPVALAANPQTTDPLVRGIQHAASDRVATATAQVILPEYGAAVMAIAIMISTFGCANGLILAGARAYYAMARDGLFFQASGRLNAKHVPAWGLVIQGIWAAALVLPRTVLATNPDGQTRFGNLYNNLLTYVISAALVFYILTITGIFVLRVRRPAAHRPYRAFGYPLVPALYVAGASVILVMLFLYQAPTTWPGLGIVATGVPVYMLWRRGSTALAMEPADPTGDPD